MNRIALTIILTLVWGTLISIPAVAVGTMMIETRVLTLQGQELGTIKRVILSDSGCIRYVIISSRGRLIPIPWSAVKVSPRRHAILVRVDRTILQNAPAIGSGQWTQINEHEVKQYYQSHVSRGKQPLRERKGRVEKRGASRLLKESSAPGAKSFHKPATAGGKVRGKAKVQAQSPSKPARKEMRKSGHPKELTKKATQRPRPPSKAPSAVQQQKSGAAKPGVVTKPEKPKVGGKEDPARKQGQSEESGKPGPTTIKE